MTTVRWIPLFKNPDLAGILIDSLKFLQAKRGLIVYAYVIMEEHLHAVVAAPELSKTLKEFKSFTARAIVDTLKNNDANGLLVRLEKAKMSFKIQSDYQVWQEGNHPEAIFSEQMLLQKINYIHHNPVRRGYVDEPRHWRYSSARDYEGNEGLIGVVTDWHNPEVIRSGASEAARSQRDVGNEIP